MVVVVATIITNAIINIDDDYDNCGYHNIVVEELLLSTLPNKRDIDNDNHITDWSMYHPKNI